MVNITNTELIMDLIGFLIIFIFGGFESGRSALLTESDKTRKNKCYKFIGATMVILGFVFQIIGNMAQ